MRELSSEEAEELAKKQLAPQGEDRTMDRMYLEHVLRKSQAQGTEQDVDGEGAGGYSVGGDLGQGGKNWWQV